MQAQDHLSFVDQCCWTQITSPVLFLKRQITTKRSYYNLMITPQTHVTHFNYLIRFSWDIKTGSDLDKDHNMKIQQELSLLRLCFLGCYGDASLPLHEIRTSDTKYTPTAVQPSLICGHWQETGGNGSLTSASSVGVRLHPPIAFPQMWNFTLTSWKAF